ncbi:MAG TPA: helix-turn-helix domain-containing protein, partial [Gammaproteobacteria bacterium]
MAEKRQKKQALRKSPRVARRRRRMREALLTAGARQFAARGVAQVSVEDLLAEADVSRATFYDMFSSKYNLLESILNPIF